jgi:hypothetical protein
VVGVIAPAFEVPAPMQAREQVIRRHAKPQKPTVRENVTDVSADRRVLGG